MSPEISPGFGLAFLVAGGFLLVLVVEAVVIASRYRRVGPNQALVISGRRRFVTNPSTGKREVVGYRIVRGGGTLVWPIVERMDVLSLEVVAVPVKAEAVAEQGEPVQVEGVVQVKIKGDDVSISAAAECFLSQGAAQIENVVRELFISHLQAVVGMSTLEEVTREPMAVAERVRGALAKDVERMGLEVVSLNIHRIREARGDA